eukprot:GFYU01003576.1.p2 GENE.GFYU01003576.1~~GFYU01003576.1.p2  ORF type:complete len:448 (+),score=183.95 GFYU01003576.1:162-1505(+)
MKVVQVLFVGLILVVSLASAAQLRHAQRQHDIDDDAAAVLKNAEISDSGDISMEKLAAPETPPPPPADAPEGKPKAAKGGPKGASAALDGAKKAQAESKTEAKSAGDAKKAPPAQPKAPAVKPADKVDVPKTPKPKAPAAVAALGSADDAKANNAPDEDGEMPAKPKSKAELLADITQPDDDDDAKGSDGEDGTDATPVVSDNDIKAAAESDTLDVLLKDLPKKVATAVNKARKKAFMPSKDGLPPDSAQVAAAFDEAKANVLQHLENGPVGDEADKVAKEIEKSKLKALNTLPLKAPIKQAPAPCPFGTARNLLHDIRKEVVNETQIRIRNLESKRARIEARLAQIKVRAAATEKRLARAQEILHHQIDALNEEEAADEEFVEEMRDVMEKRKMVNEMNIRARIEQLLDIQNVVTTQLESRSQHMTLMKQLTDTARNTTICENNNC